MNLTMEAKKDHNNKGLTLKGLQTHIIGAIVGAVTSGIVLVVFFYFNTNYTLTSHTDKLNDFDSRQKKVESSIAGMSTDIAVVKADVGNVKSDVQDIKQTQKEIQQDIKEVCRVILMVNKNNNK